MPLYEYACQKCSHRTEKLISMDKRNEALECSKCGSTSVRVNSIPAPPQFRGGGWTEKFHSKEPIDNS